MLEKIGRMRFLESKNILFVIDSMGMGGAEKVTLAVAKGFLDKGYHVDLIICDNLVQLDIPQEINLYSLDFKKSFMDYTRYRHKLHRMIDTLTEKNGRGYALILVELQKATRLMMGYTHPNIYHCVHSTLSQTAFKNRKGAKLFLKKRTLQNIYDGLNLITVSNGVQDDLVKVIGIKPKSIRTIYNPIDKDHITRLSQESNPIKENDYIVHVGRFDPAKRHDVLLKAFALSSLDTKLVLVGDGSQREKIIEWIDELGLQDKVIMTGFVQNPYPIIKNAKLLVLSSEFEGLPTVLIEALMLGVPVVSTDCKSGPREIMTDGLSEYLVPVNDVVLLSNKLNYFYATPYNIASSIVNNFDLEIIVKKYFALIPDLN